MNEKSASASPGWVQHLAKWMFILAVLFFLAGSAMTFAPGADESWYSLCAVLAAGGILYRATWVRILSTGVLLLSINGAWEGHRHLILHREMAQRISILQKQAH